MANCQRCGSEVKPGEKFCNNCGACIILPAKRQRLNFLPWVAALLTAATALIFLIPSVISVYRRYTGIDENEKRKQIMSDCEITVSDAGKEIFSSEAFGENTIFRYPRVEIEGRITDEANARIRDRIAKYNEGKDKGNYAANYTYYVNGNVVSILAEVYSLTVYRAHYHYVFNISIETGKLLKRYEMRKQSGVSSGSFSQAVKETYEIYFDTADLTEQDKEWMLRHVSFDSLDVYFGENGHLCFGIDIEKEKGSNEYVRFDVETKECLKSPIAFN